MAITVGWCVDETQQPIIRLQRLAVVSCAGFGAEIMVGSRGSVRRVRMSSNSPR